MDYIKQLNAFMEMASGNLTPNAIAIYLRLFHINNKTGWKEWFAESDCWLGRSVGINRSETILKALNLLKQKGFIDFVRGTGTRQPTKYKILLLKISSGDSSGNSSGHSSGTRNIPKLETINNKQVNNTVLSSQKKYDCPFEEIIAIFSELCPSLPQIRKIDDRRKKNINARWSDTFDKDIERVREFFTLVSQSAFLNGDNNNGWTASFDWLMNKTNANKVFEGNYRNRKEGGTFGNTGRKNETGTKPETDEERINSFRAECRRADDNQVYPWEIS